MVTVFVETGKRKLESQEALGLFSLKLAQQHYAELPDGNLGGYVDDLAQIIASLMTNYNLNTVVSFAGDGFDGHPDHIATYYASELATMASGAAHFIRQQGVFGYETHVIHGDSQLKISAIEHHRSQYNLQEVGFWRRMDLYGRQLEEEHYMRIS